MTKNGSLSYALSSLDPHTPSICPTSHYVPLPTSPPPRRITMSRPHRSNLDSQPGQPPPRATTAPTKKHHHHIPHRPHRVHGHHRNEQRVPQSAVEPRAGPTRFGDSKGGSRNNVSNVHEGAESTSRDGSRKDGSRKGSGAEKEQKKAVTWADVERARSKKKEMDEYASPPLKDTYLSIPVVAGITLHHRQRTTASTI